MEWIPIFLGVLMALAFYLHFITKINEKEDKFKDADIEVDEKNKIHTKEKNKDTGLKKRICPLCHSFLEKHESLYAEMYEGEIRPKVIIHGCKYCYKPSGVKKGYPHQIKFLLL